MLLICILHSSILQTFLSSISSLVLPYLLAVFLFILHVLPLLSVFQGKTHPAPSARPFGAMRRLELWY